MRRVRIHTPNVDVLKKAIAFLATRNEGPVFIPWETERGAVFATPEDLDQEHALYREAKAEGFAVSVYLDSDNAANLARIKAAIAGGATIKPLFDDPAEK